MNNEKVSYAHETVAPAKTFVHRGVPQTRLIAGISVPDSPLITAVIEHAQRLSEPYLFNHAMRSWLFAEAIGRTKGIDYDREVVAIGTILHDIGLTASGAVFTDILDFAARVVVTPAQAPHRP
jgi:hypothetical protein